MLHQKPTPFVFSQEVQRYMELNGYQRTDARNMRYGMTFMKGDNIVTFYCKKIETRVIPDPNNRWATHVIKEYNGFDGKNIFQLMLLLHIMDAVNIKEVREEAMKEMKLDSNEVMELASYI